MRGTTLCFFVKHSGAWGKKHTLNRVVPLSYWSTEPLEGWLYVGQPCPDSVLGQFSHTVQLKLLHDVAAMHVDRAGGYVQILAYLR